ncbi:MAG: transglycosylase domain-containing protein [Spirochaetales bacterium]|nr:transglycosylase domain-containing protein [Spirochaetales bacterium]
MPARFYTHRCNSCHLTYRVLLFVEKRVLYRIRCPDCRTRYFFDNRDGGLEELPRRNVLLKALTEEELRPGEVTDVAEEPLRRDGLLASSIENLLRRQVTAARRPDPQPALHTDQEPVLEILPPEALLPEVELPVLSDRPEDPPPRRWRFPSVRLLRLPDLERSGNLLPAPSTARGFYAAILVSVFLGASAVFAIFPGLFVLDSATTVERRLLPVEPNRIIDRDGRLLAELYSRRTSNLPLREYPLTLRRMLVFVEDREFYNHNGLRLPAILRAMFENTRALRYIQGGSTITQQLARIVLGDRDRNLWRKVRELALALYLERRYNKDIILAAYMNTIYMGHGAYGVEMASRFYLGREVSELNFAEELLLVTLLPAPENYSPLRNPGRLAQRMDRIFERMQKERYPGRVARPIYEHQKKALFTRFHRSPNENIFARRFDSAPYVTEHVRLTLRRILGQEYEYDENLVIHTTLSRALQKAATDTTVQYIEEKSASFPMRRGISADSRWKQRIKQEFASTDLLGFLHGLPVESPPVEQLQAALIGVAPETGEILFMQGGATFSPTNQFNRAVDMRRQTGSAIKPFVYAAAIEQGKLTPSSAIADAPLKLGRNSWEPRNFSGSYKGSVSVRQALRESLNNPAVRVGMLVGLEQMGQQFRRFFFHSDQEFARRFRADYTIAIGSLEMSPLEMAVAYAAFANNGVMVRPYLIRRITDADRRVLYVHDQKDEFGLGLPPSRRVMPADVAHIMSSLLLESGKMGGVAAGGFDSDRPLMGKTGTSNDHRDAWFVGVMPGISAAVWVGYDDSRFSMSGATGSSLAGPLFGRVLKSGLSRSTQVWPENFHFDPEAPLVALCPRTGLLAGPDCPRHTERLTLAHLPTRRCPGHRERGKINPTDGVRRLLEKSTSPEPPVEKPPTVDLVPEPTRPDATPASPAPALPGPAPVVPPAEKAPVSLPPPREKPVEPAEPVRPSVPPPLPGPSVP